MGSGEAIVKPGDDVSARLGVDEDGSVSLDKEGFPLVHQRDVRR